MLAELKFVQGAVAKKDLVPAMKHFRIQDGHVRAWNGDIAISTPIALDISCSPEARTLVAAISNCHEATTVSVTAAGRLSIRSGKFRALVNTLQDPMPDVLPEGEAVEFDGAALLEAFRILYPFIGTDASRPFTNGVLLDEGSAYATNNTCLVQFWLGAVFPVRVNVPRSLIREVLRVGEPPVGSQVTDHSITFHYPDGRWIRGQLSSAPWPKDLVHRLLDQPSNPTPLPEDFFTGLATIKSLADGASRVYMIGGKLCTNLDPEEGAVYEVGVPSDGLYNLHMLSLLDGVVSSIDFTRYTAGLEANGNPGHALFFGDRLRGAIIGMRM